MHLPVKPGTDVAVALAIHRHLFENGFADEAFLREHTRGADRLRERAEPVDHRAGGGCRRRRRGRARAAAELYATSSPALIRCGWGLERNRNGGNAAMAVLALPAVGGKFGVRGGGYSMSNSASWNIERPWIAAPEPATRIVNMNHLGRALTDTAIPPVDVLFVYNCNPAATVPDQRRVLRGLEREDLFTVVFEQVMTDTALYADVVLPATTFLEGYDFAQAPTARSTSSSARPVVDAVGEARSNADVFGELCARLGVLDEGEPAGELDLLVRVLDDLPGHDRRRSARGRPARAAVRRRRPFSSWTCSRTRPTARSTSFRRRSTRARPRACTGSSRIRRPTAIRWRSSRRRATAPSARRSASSRPDVKLTMNPADAAARGLSDGDGVRVFNELGEVHCTLEVLPTRPGTVSLPKGSGGAARATA